MGGNKISALGVSPKWVKSNERRRRKKKERAKVGVNNGQYNAWTKYAKTKYEKISQGAGGIFFGYFPTFKKFLNKGGGEFCRLTLVMAGSNYSQSSVILAPGPGSLLAPLLTLTFDLLSPSLHTCFSHTSGHPRKLICGMPPNFDPNRRNM